MTELVSVLQLLADCLFVVAVASTVGLGAALAISRALGDRVIAADALWKATLSFLLLLPVAVLVLGRFDPPPLTGWLPSAAAAPAITPAATVGPIAAPELIGGGAGQGATPAIAAGPILEVGAAALRAPRWPNLRVAAAALALAGTLVLAVRLLVSYVGLHLHGRRAEACCLPVWNDALRRMAAELGLRAKVRLLVSQRFDSPVTAGWLRPVIVVPQDFARSADPFTVEAVLLHELTHIQRGDFVAQLLWRMCECVYWWNPLVWTASRRVSEVRELVCDGYCAGELGDRAGYARVLIEAARRVSGRRAQWATVAMARTPRLEARLDRIAVLRVGSRQASPGVRAAGSLAAVMVAAVVGSAFGVGPAFANEVTDAGAGSGEVDASEADAEAPAADPLQTRLYKDTATSAEPADDQAAQQRLRLERQRELVGALAQDPRFQLERGETLRFLPAGLDSEPLAELRKLVSDIDRTAWIQFQSVGPAWRSELRERSWSFEDQEVVHVLSRVLGLRLHQLVFDRRGFENESDRVAFLEQKLNGDWVSRHDPTLRRPIEQEELDVLANAISNVSGGRCQLQLTQTSTWVYVATGDYRFQPLTDAVDKGQVVQGPVAEMADGAFLPPVRRTLYTATVARSFEDFIDVWSELLLMPIVDQVGSRPIKNDFFISLPGEKLESLMTPLTADQERELVESFTAQTGLKLTKAQRQTPVVRVSFEAAE